MAIHTLNLTREPFATIKSGNKVIESRLYDAKRRKIELNIIFINRDQPEQSIEVRVIGLLRYPSFHELFISNQPQKFGGSSVEELESQIDKFYSFDEQKKYGVIGIEFSKA